MTFENVVDDWKSSRVGWWVRTKWVFTSAFYAGGSRWRRWSPPCRSQSPPPSSTSSPASSSSSSSSSSSWWASPTATGIVREGQSLWMLSWMRGRWFLKSCLLFLLQEAKKLGLYCSWNEYLSQLREMPFICFIQFVWHTFKENIQLHTTYSSLSFLVQFSLFIRLFCCHV